MNKRKKKATECMRQTGRQVVERHIFSWKGTAFKVAWLVQSALVCSVMVVGKLSGLDSSE